MITKFRTFLRGPTLRSFTSYEMDLISMQINLPSTVTKEDKIKSATKKKIAEALSSPMKIDDKDDQLMEDLHNDPVFRAYFFI